MSSSGRQSHFAGGFELLWTASSKYVDAVLEGLASYGVDVMVKPPAFDKPGTKVSTQLPGKNFTGDLSVLADLEELGGVE